MTFSHSIRALAFPLVLLVTGGVAKRPVAVHLAGDSTMAEKRAEKRPETGWGEALQQHFAQSKVRVVNHAMNGRSTRTFIAEGRWQALVDSLHRGDWVLIQFGHNDGSKEKVDRYTPPDDYRRNLARFVADVRARRANPVLMTPVRRRKFDAAGALVDTHGEYPDLVRAVAREQRVPLLDLHARTGELLSAWGPDSSRRLFLQLPAGMHANYPAGIEDNTHFSPLGAELVARLVVVELEARVPELAGSLRRRIRGTPRGGRAGGVGTDQGRIRDGSGTDQGRTPAPLSMMRSASRGRARKPVPAVVPGFSQTILRWLCANTNCTSVVQKG